MDNGGQNLAGRHHMLNNDAPAGVSRNQNIRLCCTLLIPPPRSRIRMALGWTPERGGCSGGRCALSGPDIGGGRA